MPPWGFHLLAERPGPIEARAGESHKSVGRGTQPNVIHSPQTVQHSVRPLVINGRVGAGVDLFEGGVVEDARPRCRELLEKIFRVLLGRRRRVEIGSFAE